VGYIVAVEENSSLDVEDVVPVVDKVFTPIVATDEAVDA
jgi:hypothetical protein